MDVKLTKFLPSLTEVPSKELEALKDRSLKTVSDAGHVYDQPGKHTVCVKVVDVFGCDTSITVEVEV